MSDVQLKKLLKMNSNILYICVGHQDQDHKVDYLLNILKRVKEEGGDICYGTHTDFRLSEISEYCDYIIYDKNNEYLDDNFFFQNCQSVEENAFSGFFTYTYSPVDGIILKNMFSTSHNKPCMVNIKNSVSIAKSNNYEWIVFFEYDSLLPDGNLHERVKKRIKVLENTGKSGYGYVAEDMRKGLLFPHLFISKTDVFYNDKSFVKPCRTNLEFLKTYGNLVTEEILLRIFNNNENFILTSSFNIESDYDFDNDLTNSLSGNDRFSLFDAGDANHHKIHSDIFKRECKLEFYPVKISDNVYNIDFWITQRNNISYNFDYIKILIDGHEIINLQNFVRDSKGWHSMNVISNYNLGVDPNILLEFNYQVTLPNSEVITNTFKMNLENLEKYFLYRNLEHI